MCILGQFGDRDDPDNFVWMRGFADMDARKRALEAFYGGPVWKQHAEAARATMLDASNVLLLRPVVGLALDPSGRQPPGGTAEPSGLLAITNWPLVHATAGEVPLHFRVVLKPALSDARITVLAATPPNGASTPSRHCLFARTRTSSSGWRCSTTKPLTRGMFARSSSPPAGATRHRSSLSISQGTRRSSGSSRPHARPSTPDRDSRAAGLAPNR
jgi:hypothetical protein